MPSGPGRTSACSSRGAACIVASSIVSSTYR